MATLFTELNYSFSFVVVGNKNSPYLTADYSLINPSFSVENLTHYAI